jgi:hypothetical protein
MKKEYIIGAVALAAVVGGYFWWKSKSNKAEPQTEPTKPQAESNPLEGKNIALKGADGKYGGGAVYRVKNGKKMWYGNNQFESGYGINWDKYCETNTDCNEKLVLVSQAVIDKIPDAPKPTKTAFTGQVWKDRQVL